MKSHFVMAEALRALGAALVIGGLLVSGPPSPSEAAEVPAEPMSLAGSEWGFPEETAAPLRSVQFDGHGTVSGSGGCNRFSGAYEQTGTGLSIRQLRTTLMACLDDGVMARERDFLALLAATARVNATHLVLKLHAEDGRLLALLHRRDFD
jgi:heat shock protein HslJ